MLKLGSILFQQTSCLVDNRQCCWRRKIQLRQDSSGTKDSFHTFHKANRKTHHQPRFQYRNNKQNGRRHLGKRLCCRFALKSSNVRLPAAFCLLHLLDMKRPRLLRRFASRNLPLRRLELRDLRDSNEFRKKRLCQNLFKIIVKKEYFFFNLTLWRKWPINCALDFQ